ncbi:MAG: ParB/RepB/Spo0J family partition protein [Opitutales bacterium]|nr:ParB/RepB/Spo0J family partition protein [Opitutales bacterium]
MAKERKSLGRGLSSIIAGGGKAVVKPQVKAQASPPEKHAATAPASQFSAQNLYSEILIDKIVPSPFQARREFLPEEVNELAESIASEGLMQPVVVRKLPDGKFELIAGERRWRACRQLGLKRIMANVQTASDASSAVKGLIENLQRSDLNPMEEALGFANLMANFKLTQDMLSRRIGKSRSAIANSLRLLTLPKEVQNLVSAGRLSVGNAKVLLGLEDKAQQAALARRIVETDMNVRATEIAVAKIKSAKTSSPDARVGAFTRQSAVLHDLENKIREKLNANVEIKHSPKKGKIIIDYMGNDDLARILDIIGIKA